MDLIRDAMVKKMIMMVMVMIMIMVIMMIVMMMMIAHGWTPPRGGEWAETTAPKLKQTCRDCGRC